MPDERDARRALLVSGALTGDLTAAEQSELDVLRASDPSIDDEIRELTDVLNDTTGALSGWDFSSPSDSLRERVLALEQDTEVASESTTPAEPAPVVPLRRRAWLIAVGAAACVAIGAGGTVLLQPSAPSAPTGPPGTLGAIEQIAFTGEPSGVSVDGSLIAHTWGTETILNITGLTGANPYDVVLVTVDGESLDSGSFLGSTVEIDCEMNAAVMRESVASVEIQDESGAVVARAQLPAASS
jgi:hypothetical protein